MSRKGDAIVFAVCEEVQVNRIEIYVTPKDGDPVPYLAWSTDGEVQAVASPFEFSYGSPPDGFESSSEPRELSPRGNYVTMNFDLDVDGVAQSGVFASWDGDDISDQYWLTASGERREAPCPG